MKTEYIRNLNRNYERILPENKPDIRRYQYCMLERGGFRYLLPCSFRAEDGNIYLCYDITSSQNIRQVFSEKTIGRDWMKAFLWSMERLRQELTRFLLDISNILWSPEHVFQDLEKNDFLYTYVPYEELGKKGADGFEKMLEFWTEKIDYNDEGLSEFVYCAYERYLSVGSNYLVSQIFEDFRRMEEKKTEEGVYPREEESQMKMLSEEKGEIVNERKGFLSFLDGRKRKQNSQNTYKEEMKNLIAGYAVCEEKDYGEKVFVREEEYGKTIYIEETKDCTCALYTEKGEAAFRIEKFPFVVGKKREEADYVLDDYSASRVHARFIKEENGIYIEDLNSTNGTFKNGLRLLPYEKKELESGDMIRFGKSNFVFK